MPSRLLAVVALCVGGSASAATLDVPGSYSTIESALGAASRGDTIRVDGASYTPEPEAIVVSAGDSVIIKSGLKGTEEIATVNSFTLKAELGKGEATHEDH